jgi:hypothetical protein
MEGVNVKIIAWILLISILVPGLAMARGDQNEDPEKLIDLLYWMRWPQGGFFAWVWAWISGHGEIPLTYIWGPMPFTS